MYDDLDRIIANTDYISNENEVRFYCYSLDVLERASEIYTTPVFRIVLRALRELKKHAAPEMNGTQFTIWCGDAGGQHFYLGFDRTISAEAWDLVQKRIFKIDGFDSFVIARPCTLPVSPIFRYERGAIIEYSDYELAGTERLDNKDWYGSGLTVHRRWYEPIDNNDGKEKYCSQHGP